MSKLTNEEILGMSREEKNKVTERRSRANKKRVNKVVEEIAALFRKKHYKCKVEFDDYGRAEINEVSGIPVYLHWDNVFQNWPVVAKNKTAMKFRVKSSYGYSRYSMQRRYGFHRLAEGKSGYRPSFIVASIEPYIKQIRDQNLVEKQNASAERASAKLVKTLTVKKEPEGIHVWSTTQHADRVRISVELDLTPAQARKLLPISRKLAKQVEKESRKS